MLDTLNLDPFLSFFQPLYTDIPDPMSLDHTKTDKNQIYAELKSTQADSGTTERPQEPGHLEPVTTTITYQNSMEMKTYTNM